MNYKLLKTIVGATLIAGLGTAFYAETTLAEAVSSKKGIQVTIENAEVQTTQLEDSDEYEYFVVDFENQNGTSSFSETNDGTTYSYSNDLLVKDANQWGGANGSKFITQAELASIRSYKIKVNQDQKYFGFWWSAGDPYNKITFKNNGKIVAIFKTADLVDFIKDSGSVNTSDYYGNPAYNGANTGHRSEPYSFVNVFFDEDSYDEIVVATMTEGGSAFESDNHTFSAEKIPPRGNPLPTNLAPIAEDDVATTTIFNSVTIDVLANDSDPDHDELLLDSVSNVTGGTATIKNNKIVYTAGSNVGTFSLDYTVRDESGKTNEGKVIIKVGVSAD
jgi:hypothetical protein